MQQYLPRQSPSFSVVCTCLATWNVFFPELELYACLACSARLALLFSSVKVSPWKVRVHSSGHGSLHDDTNTKAKCNTTTNVDSQHWTTFWEMGLTVVIVQLINMTAVSDVQKLSVCVAIMLRAATGCTTKKMRIEFRQMQGSVSFAATNSSAVWPTEPSVQWMPGSSSPVVTCNITIRCFMSISMLIRHQNMLEALVPVVVSVWRASFRGLLRCRINPHILGFIASVGTMLMFIVLVDILVSESVSLGWVRIG